MTTSFVAALGALRAHQSWIDVIGNNLANSNTPGYKGSRALFADLFSITQRPGTPPTGGIGGTNPVQQGLGVQLAAVDRRLNQGAANNTGRTFDMMLQGRGLFALNDGVQTLYSRVGAFGLDATGNMVDLRSGFRVLDQNGQPFSIDTRGVFPPSATTQIGFSGNLPRSVTGPLAEELTSSSAFHEGRAAAMTGTATGPYTIPAGETWRMELVLNGGAPQQVAIASTVAPLSAQDIADQINAQSEDVVASVGTGGEVVLTSERSGTASTIKVTPGSAGRDLKSLLGLSDFIQGTETVATAATDLNDLTVNLSDYAAGDILQVAGTDVDGTPVVASFVYGTDGDTLGELVSFLESRFGQSTVAFDSATGEITVKSDATGEAALSLALTDGSGQAGRSSWSSSFFAVTTNGTGPDKITTSVEVFDSAGTSHSLSHVYERQEDGSWNLSVSLPASEGTVIAGTVNGITFNDDGSILTPTSAEIEVQFGTLAAQTIDLALGTSGQFDGLTQFGKPASVVSDEQDGYGAGELASLGVDPDGTIQGYYTNGQTQEVGSFGIATFVNESGLEEFGDSYFRPTANSGARVLGAGQIAGAGEVVAGALEASNVDTAEEFVHLIQAQRGFQANARVITVQDELLAEVVNVV
ncbi:MAG: flagellar hook-basal body complex protein [Planctomycetes bacterium]|nr:flagellar hook-basal body complex protein [Planctomycetota bacterium]